MPTVTFINQDPREPQTATYARLVRLLSEPNLRSVRLLVSYVNWQGLSAIADALETFLKRGGILQSLFGIDNGVTTPDALIYAYDLSTRFTSYRLAAVVPWQYSDSIFHPKHFQFDFDDHSVMLLGSANLTGGGVLRNHEIGVELRMSKDDPVYASSRRTWRKYAEGARAITLGLIRKLATSERLARERQRAEAPRNQPALPSVGLAMPGHRRPALFRHFLGSGLTASERHAALSRADALSLKPRRLYLEILQETGGGHQVQLPVATLGAFFGVGRGRSRPVRFSFGNEVVDVTLTHFPNHTHRVRLRPLQGVPRPALVVFRRSSTLDEYECTIATHAERARMLARCTEQTRAGSKRWGLT